MSKKQDKAGSRDVPATPKQGRAVARSERELDSVRKNANLEDVNGNLWRIIR